MSNEKKSTAKKRSTVRHTRAIQVAKTKQVPAASPDAEVEKWLTEIVHPATLRQLDHYHKMGLRERVLTLPVTVAFILSLIWRQIGSVRDLVRVMGTEGLLWMTEPVPVSQQAVSERLRTLPAELFERILADVLVQMEARWQERVRVRFLRGVIESERGEREKGKGEENGRGSRERDERMESCAPESDIEGNRKGTGREIVAVASEVADRECDEQ